MPKRSKSSDRWLKEHFADPYVQRAQASGWRSRAVFKLEEIDRREKLLKPGAICLDLGAAPGAWSQYARGRVGQKGRVVATDILPMEPLGGVEFVQGDFRDEEVFGRILSLLPQGQVDVVLSDMAPAMSGVDVTDQARSVHLSELALDMAARVLKRGGNALIKVFQGAGFEDLVKGARGEFGRVRVVKPQASRARSAEMYLLAMKFGLV
jgi:23S rRNA (uridine2552-2'-O)-methyltransferase